MDNVGMNVHTNYFSDMRFKLNIIIVKQSLNFNFFLIKFRGRSFIINFKQIEKHNEGISPHHAHLLPQTFSDYPKKYH